MKKTSAAIRHRTDPGQYPPDQGDLRASVGLLAEVGPPCELRVPGRPRVLVTSLPVVTADDLARAANAGVGRTRSVRVRAVVPGVEHPVEVELLPLAMPQGGVRWLARCPTPGCGAMRRHLHVHGGRLGCRACLAGGLSYASWRFSKTRWLTETWVPFMQARRVGREFAPTARSHRASPAA